MCLSTFLRISRYFHFPDKLFGEFLNFYSEFDFDKKSLSVLKASAKEINNDDWNSALYIENPIETDLNVCKNVSEEELEKFKTTCKNSHISLMSGNQIEKLADILFPNVSEEEMPSNSEVEAIHLSEIFK